MPSHPYWNKRANCLCWITLLAECTVRDSWFTLTELVGDNVEWRKSMINATKKGGDMVEGCGEVWKLRNGQCIYRAQHREHGSKDRWWFCIMNDPTDQHSYSTPRDQLTTLKHTTKSSRDQRIKPETGTSRKIKREIGSVHTEGFTAWRNEVREQVVKELQNIDGASSSSTVLKSRGGQVSVA